MSKPLPALVPAAGKSHRMGRPKLVLPLADGRSVIETVITALQEGGAGPILLIVPPTDEPGAAELVQLGKRSGAIIVTCQKSTADMKETVLLGVGHLEPGVPGILLTPGDSPGTTADLVDRVRRAFEEDLESVTIPTFQAKRGHPIALPWSVCERIAKLPPDQGINALIRDPATRVREIQVDQPGITDDLDTPDDYRRWLERRPHKIT